MASELAEASILELSVIARYLAVDVDAINEKHYDGMASDLLAAITNKLAEVKKAKVDLPIALKSYCERRSILLEVSV